ncbi:MAG: hypothetical protein AAFX39_01345 [Pseudomonadota bacterium]
MNVLFVIPEAENVQISDLATVSSYPESIATTSGLDVLDPGSNERKLKTRCFPALVASGMTRNVTADAPYWAALQ